MVVKIIIFLLVNFAALAIGGLLMGKGPVSEWYQELNQAPWTPPGWAFGVAWTTIMIAFSLFMAFAWNSSPNKGLLVTLFILQWILNVAWNPVFFNFHLTGWGLVIIVALTLLVGAMFFGYRSELGIKASLILPYLIWLIIATSLNAYIVFYNRGV